MMLLPFDEGEIKRALLTTWSKKTQPAFNKETPSHNQCAQTAIVICEKFGGEILKTKINTAGGYPIDHFYNRINGKRYDFTADQFQLDDFVKPIKYLDVQVPCKDVASIFNKNPNQLLAMRTGVSSNYMRVSQ
jgi:hypothetical protein